MIEEEEARCAFEIFQHSKEQESVFPISLVLPVTEKAPN
jgi:hypothetical protein